METVQAPTLRLLSYDEREAARKLAMRRVVGEQNTIPIPTREMNVRSKYPTFMFVMFLCFLFIIFAASGVSSSQKIHLVGSDKAAETFGGYNATTYLAAIATVMIAEFTVITCATMMNLFTFGKLQKAMLWLGIIIGGTVSITANAATMPTQFLNEWDRLFVYMETFGPPVVTLISSFILEALVLDALETRKASSEAYKTALAEYDKAVKDEQARYKLSIESAEQHPAFMKLYRQALLEGVLEKNKRRLAGVPITEGLSQELVQREIAMSTSLDDEYFALPTPSDAIPVVDSSPERSLVHTTVNRPLLADGKWRVSCNICDWTSEYDSERTAQLALSGHHKRHSARKGLDQ